MAKRRRTTRQNDFSFGQVKTTLAARGDVSLVAHAAKQLSNVRLLYGGGFTVRPGSRWLDNIGKRAILGESRPTTTDRFIIAFSDGMFESYSTEGVLQQQVSGCPWTDAMIDDLSWYSDEDEIIICHNAFKFQKLSYASGAWVLSDFEFAEGLGGSIRQPYWNFTKNGTTLQPSATTGSINVTFNKSFLTSEHEGLRVRYMRREIEIVSVLNDKTATATVIQELPPTQVVTVASGAGFLVGQVVGGDQTNCTGVVSAVSGANVTVLVDSVFSGFTTGEQLVGPDSNSEISAVTATSPAATLDWEEPLFSEVRGWPGWVSQHAGRLILTNHPTLADAFCMSSPDATDDFFIGSDDADGIFERVRTDDQDNPGGQVRFAMSSGNLILLTDTHCYYVPEFADVPITPTTIAFYKIGPTGTSSVKPVVTEYGVVFVESGGNRVIGIVPTGRQTRPYDITDISQHASDQIITPKRLAITNGNQTEPERYVFALNSDGTAAVLHRQDPETLGWVPWTTDGAFESLIAISGEIYAVVNRTIAGADAWLLEKFDQTARLDASSDFADPSAKLKLVTSTGEEIVDSTGDNIVTSFSGLPQLAGADVHLMSGTRYFGEYTVDVDGLISNAPASSGNYEAGLLFQPICEPWCPPPEDGEPIACYQRIVSTQIRVKDSVGYKITYLGRSRIVPAYRFGDDIDAEPPQRTEKRKHKFLGRGDEPTFVLTQVEPGPLTVLSIGMEVS